MAIFSQKKGKIEINTKGHTIPEMFGAFMIKDGKAVIIGVVSLILSTIIFLYTKHIGYSLIPESVFIPKFFTTIVDWFKK